MARRVQRARQVHPSHVFERWSPAIRPAHIAPSDDPRIQWIPRFAIETLEPYLPPTWPEPYHSRTAEYHLRAWTMGLGTRITECSADTTDCIDSLLCRADGVMQWQMNEWLQGRWSYGIALRDLLWYLETGPLCVSAAMWLYQTAGAGDKRPSPG